MATVSRPCAVAPHRITAAQVAERGHRDHPLWRADQIAADDSRTDGFGFVPHAVGQFGGLRCGRIRRRTEGDDEGGGACAHRLDVGGILRNRLAAHVEWCRPVQPEMPICDQHVGRHHGPAVGGVHHGGIVPGPNATAAGWLRRATRRSITPNSPTCARVSSSSSVAIVTSCRTRRQAQCRAHEWPEHRPDLRYVNPYGEESMHR